MSPGNTKHLVEKYPKIFSHILNPGPPPHMPISLFIFECGDGWYNILDKLCSNIQGHIDWKRKERNRNLRYNRALKRALAGDKSNLIKYHSYKDKVTDYTLMCVDRDIENPLYRKVTDKIPQVVVDQVKEKFGGLRFYYSGGDEYISGLVSMAESMSYATCEECGNPGKPNIGGWIRTLCTTHRHPMEVDT